MNRIDKAAADLARRGHSDAIAGDTSLSYRPDGDDIIRRTVAFNPDEDTMRTLRGAYDAAYNSVACATYVWHPINAHKTPGNWWLGVVQSSDGFCTEGATCGHDPGHGDEITALDCAERLAKRLNDAEPHKYLYGHSGLMCHVHGRTVAHGSVCTDGDKPSDDYTTRDLDLIYQSLEVTSQTLDRPEPGTAEHLDELMAKTMRLSHGKTAPVDVNAEPAEPVKIEGVPRVRLMHMIDTLIETEHAVSGDAAAVAALWAIGRPLRQLWVAGQTADELADEMLRDVHADMAKPFAWGKQIPRDVPSWSALHDYCDANEYLFRFPMPLDQTDVMNRFINRVIDRADEKIRDGALQHPQPGALSAALRVAVDAAKQESETPDA